MSLKEYSLSCVTDLLGREVDDLSNSDFVNAVAFVREMSSPISRKNFGKQIIKKNMEGRKPRDERKFYKLSPVSGLVKLMSRK
jgi:hypothetical protein